MRVLLVTLLLVPALLDAAEMRHVHVEYDGERYRMESEVLFAVDVEPLYEVFADYDLSPQFSSWIVDARDLAADEHGRPGYYIHNRGCVLFVCKSVVRQGHVERDANARLAAIAHADKSDFEISNEVWTFESVDGGTVVVYTLEMKPKFWVPPVIGPMVIKRKLRSSGGDALDRIEALAQQRAGE